MKKIIVIICSFFWAALSQVSLAQPPADATATPIAIPVGKHDIGNEITRHVDNQKKRIKKAVDAKLITADQAKTLLRQVISVNGRVSFYYHQNQASVLKQDQETQIYQLLTASARAIDQAAGPSSDPS